jgi:hypothetical protein
VPKAWLCRLWQAELLAAAVKCKRRAKKCIAKRK